MQYTILGFNQKKMIELGLDVKDALILRWMVDFQNTGKMRELIIDGKKYIWVNYSTIVDELPILGFQKKSVMLHLGKMVKAGLLEKFIYKKAGNFTFFHIVEDVYYSLVSDGGKKFPTSEKNFHRVWKKISIGYGKKLQDIDSSINDSSISNNTVTYKNEKLEIPEPFLKKLKESFPSIDVESEIKKMEAWLLANPKKRKKNYARFIVNWLSRIQKPVGKHFEPERYNGKEEVKFYE